MTKQMTEAQMVGLVRNALLVAGSEIGSEGDHWPVVNEAVLSLARDLTSYEIQRSVDAEMETHLRDSLASMRGKLSDMSLGKRSGVSAQLDVLQDMYDAYFSPLDVNAEQPIHPEELPRYLASTKEILKELNIDPVEFGTKRHTGERITDWRDRLERSVKGTTNLAVWLQRNQSGEFYNNLTTVLADLLGTLPTSLHNDIRNSLAVVGAGAEEPATKVAAVAGLAPSRSVTSLHRPGTSGSSPDV